MIFEKLARRWRGLSSIHSALNAQGLSAYRRYEELVSDHCAWQGVFCEISLPTYFDERSKEYVCSGGKVSENRRAETDWGRAGYRSAIIDRLVIEQDVTDTHRTEALQRVRSPHPCLDSFYNRRATDQKYALSVSAQVRVAVVAESQQIVTLTDSESQMSSSKSLLRNAFESVAVNQGFVKDRRNYAINACDGVVISVSADFSGRSTPLSVSLNVTLIDTTDDDMPYPILLSSVIPGYGYYETFESSSLDLKHQLVAQLAGVRALADNLR